MQQEFRYVYQVYKEGSISKAARSLYITQPALSIAIQKIEDPSDCHCSTEAAIRWN